MKVLIIQPGNSVNKNEFDNKSLVKEPTLVHGESYFVEIRIINNKQTKDSIQKQGVNVIYRYLVDRKNILHLVKSGMEISGIIKKHKVDVVHVFWGGISSLVLKFFINVPSVVSFLGSDIYGTYDYKGKKTLNGKLQATFSRLSMILYSKSIVMSYNMKKLAWPIVKNKIEVLPRGVDLTKFEPKNQMSAKKKLGWNLSKQQVLFFHRSGAFVKNYALAKKTFELLKTKEESVEFKVVDGIPHDELVDYYNAADLVLFTSYHEGSNNSLKEAMACNLPIVSVNCGDALERLNNVKNSKVLSSYDSGLLVNAMLEILVKNERSNSREYVENISMEKIAKQFVSIYSELN